MRCNYLCFYPVTSSEVRIQDFQKLGGIIIITHPTHKYWVCIQSLIYDSVPQTSIVQKMIKDMALSQTAALGGMFICSHRGWLIYFFQKRLQKVITASSFHSLERPPCIHKDVVLFRLNCHHFFHAWCVDQTLTSTLYISQTCLVQSQDLILVLDSKTREQDGDNKPVSRSKTAHVLRLSGSVTPAPAHPNTSQISQPPIYYTMFQNCHNQVTNNSNNSFQKTHNSVKPTSSSSVIQKTTNPDVSN